MAAFEMAKMDMTLDDIIKAKKNTEKGFGNKAGNNPWRYKNFNNSKPNFKPLRSPQNDFKAKFGRGAGGGPFKGLPPHRRDLVARNMAGEQSAPNPVSFSHKILVGNLSHTVSESDIIELFNEFGVLKSARLHHDDSGTPIGTAEVIFQQPASARKAAEKYNGVCLDGRPLHIQLPVDYKQQPRPQIPNEDKFRFKPNHHEYQHPKNYNHPRGATHYDEYQQPKNYNHPRGATHYDEYQQPKNYNHPRGATHYGKGYQKDNYGQPYFKSSKAELNAGDLDDEMNSYRRGFKKFGGKKMVNLSADKLDAEMEAYRRQGKKY